MNDFVKDMNIPTNDCISRQAAIDAILGITPMQNTIPLDSAIFNIKKLPSARPDMKHAKWIPVTNSRGGHKCSLCNSYAPSCQSGYELLSNYCPDCGAKMDEEESQDA